MRGNLAGFFLQLLNGVIDRGAAHSGGPAAKGANAVLHDGSIAMDHGYIINIHAKLISGQLGEGSFLSLAVW